MIEYNLPESWEISTIGEICEDSQYGFTTKAAEFGTVKFLRTTDISSNNINWDTVPYCSENPKDINKLQLKSGDVVISRSGTIGISALINNPPKAVFASYMIRFRPRINERFFYYFLQSPIYWELVEKHKVGIAVQNLNATKIKSFPIPLPPAHIQGAIVSRIESLFLEIDSGIEALSRAQKNIGVYKQSILNAAIRGKLVPQDPNDEPASVLLERIRDEKKALIAAGKLKKEKPLAPITADEIPFELPEGWKWCRLGDLLEVLTDYHANGSYEYLKENVFLSNEPDFAIMLRTTNFSTKGRQSFIYVNRKAYQVLAKSKLEPNDLIMNKIADPGSVFLVPDLKQPMTLAMNLFLLRTNRRLINNPYLHSYLSINEEYVKSFAKGSTTKTITKDAVRQLIVPLPPLSEQIRIADHISMINQTICKNEKAIENLLLNMKLLKQSILKSAFEGKLL